MVRATVFATHVLILKLLLTVAFSSKRRCGGFYFARALKLCSDVFFAKRYDFGCNFCFAPSLLMKQMGQGGEEKQVPPNIV